MSFFDTKLEAVIWRHLHFVLKWLSSILYYVLKKLERK